MLIGVRHWEKEKKGGGRVRRKKMCEEDCTWQIGIKQYAQRTMKREKWDKHSSVDL